MTSIQDLASSAITAISPLLPYLTAAGTIAAKAAIDGMGKGAGAAAWKGAEAVWKRIADSAPGDAKLEGAIRLLGADPKDADSLQMLQKTLAGRMERDQEFQEALVLALGGKESVQQMIAAHGSRIAGSSQQMDADGRQEMKATDNSIIENSHQSSRK